MASLIGQRIGQYEILSLLGEGGMAAVYRAIDLSVSRPVALKQLVVSRGASEQASAAALFEREFHTLVQLRHPHVIEVFDYGVSDDGNPFYTMELLDGGDLRERTPVGWREACRLTFDVCSALALLHSRRLLHRDVSPRNIRCTQSGLAKLIDFGALAPMSGGGSEVVGTPAFTAPETLQRLALDARTDLYSLGVSLYFALTGRLAYPARAFSELLDAWRAKPVPPSAIVKDIPAALDDLVLSLISVEPALRPQNAFVVMQQLAACAELRVEESEAVSRAYLSTPTLVGRDGVLSQLRDKLRDARLSRAMGVLFEGRAGAGRSRLLDACALEAQTRGFTVLRATATGTPESFATARALTEHLLDAVPPGRASEDFKALLGVPPAEPSGKGLSVAPRPVLRSFTDPALTPAVVQRALRELWTGVCRTHPLLIAVDDVHKIDQPSAALLAEVIDKNKRGGMLIALTADSEDTESVALPALARRCTILDVTPLSLEQTRALLGSLFGDVAHLDMLSSEIHEVALGNPRESLELAQHLVDRGLIRYNAGSWTLPSRLSAEDMPRSTVAAMHARIEKLSQHARFMAEAQALAYYDTFTDEDYRLLLPGVSGAAIELALSELLTAQALVRDGAEYRLGHRIWVAALSDGLDPEQAKSCHRALAGLYLQKQSFAFIHHAFLCGMDEEGLQALDRRNETSLTEADYLKLVEQDVRKLQWCYPHAIATARALGQSPRQVHDLRRWQYLAAVVNRGSVDPDSARQWLEQLIHDSGLDLYRADTQSTVPAERLMRALQAAVERYQATPEHERVYPVDQAIRKLGEYVVVSIAVVANTLDMDHLSSLPGLVEPFISLSPLLEGIWNNASATVAWQRDCQLISARDRWRETLAKLDTLDNQDESFLTAMRNAIASAIGTLEAQLGLVSATDVAERLDRDPFQRISALDLRRIVRLEQGDAEGGERLRRQAEVLALQMRVPQMFKFHLNLELAAYTQLGDLKEVANVIERMKPMAARFPNWEPNLLIAQASFHIVRGDHEAALSDFERASVATGVNASGEPKLLLAWLVAEAGRVECLLALGRTEEARAAAAAAVALCDAKQLVEASIDLRRVLALAEAKLGEPSGTQRLDEVIALQNQLGTTGLRLGLSYEARARIAVWSGDGAAFEQFAELTARAYRHGARTALAVRYERLINEAARSGMRTAAALGDFAALASDDTSSLQRDALLTVVTRNMASSRSAEERVQLALQMICSAHGSSVGHLYLITPAGLVLRASLGTELPEPELSQRVTLYVANKQQRSDELDDMVTGELVEDDALTSLVRADTASYELLPMTSVTAAVSTLAGVAVIQVTHTRVRNEKQAQLLSALATSLLETGDCEGLRLTAPD